MVGREAKLSQLVFSVVAREFHERRDGIAPIRVPLTFLWLSSLSTDKPLEDTLFSDFFRGLGCFVNNRWRIKPEENR